jgi:hypothetical protein
MSQPFEALAPAILPRAWKSDLQKNERQEILKKNNFTDNTTEFLQRDLES